MRAAHYEQFGPAEDVLSVGEVDTPTPGPGEVLVRLTHSGVNPSDAKSRAGSRPGVTKPDFPRIIPHSDGAGTIFAVGEGVDPARMDQHVWLWNAQWQRAHGTAAEMIALPADQAVPLPDGVSHEVGATLGIPGLTACQTVFGGGEVAGQTLLISGGAGAVGHMAVQLAKWGGATVITTASADAADYVGRTGADHVLDYRDDDLAAKIKDLAPGGIDRAVEVEFGTNAALLAEVMKPMGTIATYGSAKAMTPELPFGPMLFKALKIDITLIYILPPAERAAAIARLHAALTEGALKPAIHACLPLSDCVTAHNMVLSPGRRGAVLLETV
ncbi:zinc-binding dehydrogenase [Roseovarius atlanticus]|uniref:Zinc-binding dehydrogenase n=1 Tax=Roseovarius atlanticus TaxID=1641875 RepID=A0A0T5NQH4_9RHOB|nr:NADPH:quinone reductase [Roseovarius atlanticus]KRS11008.1 zinc-binding dehydrogenase [Roseovarius atlanticus]